MSLGVSQVQSTASKNSTPQKQADIEQYKPKRGVLNAL
jgi:hypothetical protein